MATKKHTAARLDKSVVSAIDSATSDLDILREALKQYSDRLIATFYEPGSEDLNLFPALAAARCDQIVSRINAALRRIDGIAEVRNG